jgi:hypothetical protein
MEDPPVRLCFLGLSTVNNRGQSLKLTRVCAFVDDSLHCATTLEDGSWPCIEQSYVQVIQRHVTKMTPVNSDDLKTTAASV